MMNNSGDEANEDDFTVEGGLGDPIVIKDEPTLCRETSKASVKILLEFLEIAIHQILYVKRVYQKESFVKRKKYSIPVWMSAHPGLSQYITQSLHSLQEILQQDKISQLCVLLKENHIPAEQYVFEIKMFQEEVKKVEDFIKMEQSLRSFLLGIQSNSAITSSMDQELTFEILIGCTFECEIELNNTDSATKWIVLDTADIQNSQKMEKLIPIKAVTESPLFNMQLLIKRVL